MIFGFFIISTCQNRLLQDIKVKSKAKAALFDMEKL
jgi:hypothetical protein